jgi:Zn-dependent M28 family amino/carboxypeptidase
VVTSGIVVLLGFFLAACSGKPISAASATAEIRPETQNTSEDAPPAEKTGGFDGNRAFAHVAKQVGFGPRPSGSAAIGQLQEYIQSELTSYGCKTDVDSFTADTPAGRLPMKNIVAKISGDKPGIIMLATHYDTVLLPNFVGANDGGSSTGVMLELARLLCTKHGPYQVWITFFDGEEAMKKWSDTDSRYGSRQMAAKLAMSGDIGKIKAFLLADIVGNHPLRFLRDGYSTPVLTDLVWKTAAKLGYSSVFVEQETSIEDDHLPFRKRGVPVVDIIDLIEIQGTYWHTSQDTLDKVSAKSLAITGHVFLESVKQLQSK